MHNLKGTCILTEINLLKSHSISYYQIECCLKSYYLKDARSVSLYTYNRSQILQYVKYTK